jgi:molybdate transport system ATP-binding protein
VLLFDEPLAALDATSRRAVRAELRALLRTLACITVYVTHSPVEALLFGDRIVVLEGGRVTQTGTRDDLLRHPRSRYVAELLGTNLFAGLVVGGDGGAVRVRTADGEITVADGEPGDAFFTVDPAQVTLHPRAPEGSAQNIFHGPILELVPEPPGGARIRVALATRPPLLADVTREAVASLGLREGLEVYATFKATGVRAYR